MSQVINIDMNSRMGVSTAAIALVNGYRQAGVRAVLVVETLSLKKASRYQICPDFVRHVDELYRLVQPPVVVVDGMARCALRWNQKDEGEFVACLKQLQITHGNAGKIFLINSV